MKPNETRTGPTQFITDLFLKTFLVVVVEAVLVKFISLIMIITIKL